MDAKQPARIGSLVANLSLGLAALALLTWLCARLGLSFATTGFVYLIGIVVLSLTGSVASSALLSVVAVGCLDYFFSEPLHTVGISTPQDAAELGALLVTSVIVTSLVRRARSLADRAMASEEGLKEQARLLEQTHDAIFTWRLHGPILHWNRGAERLYGYARQEAVGRTSHELLRTEHPMSADGFEAAIERDGTWIGELTQLTRDGRKIVVDSRQVLVREADGTRVVLETNRDVTERVLYAEALRETQAHLAHVSRVTTLGEVTASFAHEVNQPLAAIVNNANACLALLAEGRGELSEVREALADIVGDAERASAVIERVRGFARRTPLERAPVQLAQVVDDVVALVSPEAKARAVRIETDLEVALPAVSGDRVQLEQVLLNLIMNGMDAMSGVTERPRLLEIRGCTEEQQGRTIARISVQDRGVGLDPGMADKLFEAFYTTKPKGMGLGLAISRSIVEAHGGRLWAESKAGPGATFSFGIPAAAAS